MNLPASAVVNSSSPQPHQACVILPIYNGYDVVQACLESLFAPGHGLDPAIHQLRLVDDASSDPRILPLLTAAAARDPRVQLIRNPRNLGYLDSVNRQLELVEGTVILLNSDTQVPPGWASRLCAGAARYPRLGALTPLSNNASFSTIPDPLNRQLPLSRADLPRLQAWAAARSGEPYPLAPTGMGFCLLLTALARRIAPCFDPRFAPGYEEENDLCQRLRAHGLQCRIATDVYVHHEGGGSFGDARRSLQDRHYRRMLAIHPSYGALVQDWFERLDQPAALLGASPPRPLHLLMEGTVLRQTLTGVVRYVLAQIDCLEASCRRGALTLTVLVPNASLQQQGQQQRPWCRWLLPADLDADPQQRWDVLHLAHTHTPLTTLMALRRQVSRVVITLHDLIAYENPSYFRSGKAYLDHRRHIRGLVALADHTLAISECTLNDAREQLALPLTRSSVFANSLHYLKDSADTPDNSPRPGGCGSQEAPFCLVVGTDFRHKHLIETVRLFRDGVLPLRPEMQLRIVGPSVDHGGTRSELEHLLASDPALAAAVHRESAISDSRLDGLYRRAALVLYLSLQEGFGYVPYEAAHRGCPTLVANTSVYAGLPDDIAVPPYLCDATRAALAALLNDPEARRRNLHLWQQQLTANRQRDPGAELLTLYQRVLAEPRQPNVDLACDWLTHNPEQLTVTPSRRQRLRRLLGRIRRRLRQRI